MGRASKKDAERHRQEIVTAAAGLFRERGIGGVSVPELMSAAGLTHGGFYGHFPSKGALAAEAVGAAADELGKAVATLIAAEGEDRAAALAAVVTFYLSRRHRDEPAHGCPTAALIDYARDSDDPALAAVYRDGVDHLAGTIQSLLPEGKGRPEALAALATMIGGLLLARATAGAPISDEILAAARGALAAAAES